MRRVGTVSRTAQGLAIVRVEGGDAPKIGAQVIDESLSKVGRIVDVFGPVDRPYVAITPTGDAGLVGLVGSKLYTR